MPKTSRHFSSESKDMSINSFPQGGRRSDGSQSKLVRAKSWNCSYKESVELTWQRQESGHKVEAHIHNSLTYFFRGE